MDGYDDNGKGIATQEAGGTNAVEVSYQATGAIVYWPMGSSTMFNYKRVGERDVLAGLSGPQCPTCSEKKSVTYDSYGFVASRTNFNDVTTTYVPRRSWAGD